MGGMAKYPDYLLDGSYEKGKAAAKAKKSKL
jgi:hypothetical protein